jgi:MoaA/NifB/PqqE/SkfB family radical SAM enzyme
MRVGGSVEQWTIPRGVKLIFELTNRCNFSCVHCIRAEDEPHDYLPVTIVDKVLREVQAYQPVNLVAFTGGEPTLHPQFADIVELVATQGYRVTFVTNGWNFLQTLAKIQAWKSSIESVSFSLDGATETTHDTLRRQPGSFRRLMQAISLCHVHSIPVHLNMVVTRANRDELEAMAILAGRLSCAALGYGHCQPTPDALTADLVLNARERRDVETDIAALQQMLTMPIVLAGDHYTASGFAQCPQLQMQEFNIDYRGYLTACCTLSSYRGGTPETDVLADLHQVSFVEAHRRLITKIAEINREKLEQLDSHAPTEAEQFLCTHCLLHYQKVPQLIYVLDPPSQPSVAPTEEASHARA